MNLLIILLGCNITALLYDRVNEALRVSYMFRNDQIDWFLSGGIKNPALIDDTMSEAHKMYEMISPFNEHYNTNEWNYIYDTTSTNSAENIVMLKKYLDKNDTLYDHLYLVTSNFHYNRASHMVDNILLPPYNYSVQWVLAPLEMENSVKDENVHIQNVFTDINQAKRKYNM